MKILEHVLDLIENIVMFIFVMLMILVYTAFLWLPWVLLLLRG